MWFAASGRTVELLPALSEDAMANFAVAKERYPQLQRSLPPQLPAFLSRQRWFGGKARQVQAAELADIIPIRTGALEFLVLVVSVKYADGTGESYSIPVSCAEEQSSSNQSDSGSLKLEAQHQGNALVLTDALKNEDFLNTLLDLIRGNAAVEGHNGTLRGLQTTAYPRLYPSSVGTLQPKPVGAEQSNTSIIYGDRLILKFFRRLEEGINPDLEVGTFLTEKAHFAHTPQLAGFLEYGTRDGRQIAQGILQAFVPNRGDAWSYTLASLREFYEAAAQQPGDVAPVGPGSSSIAQPKPDLPEFARKSVAPYLQAAGLLGQRTAQLHLALASEAQDTVFRPEPFTMEFQQALQRSLLDLTARVFGLLREKRSSLPAEWSTKTDELPRWEREATRRFQSTLSTPIHAMRVRIHGDYHLGQVLYTGSDFVIIDFEGEPARPLAERRIKRSPLQDVAGMLRSFHYAAFAPLLGESRVLEKDLRRLSLWAEMWNAWISSRFLADYFATSGEAAYLPPSREETQSVLELHLLEKAIYELGYELNNRPTWVGIPLQGLSGLLSA
jgi:maltose alpha-D-glucosyltransferase / alpha-amylase